MLRPLPYGDPERLVLVWSELRTRNVLDFPFPIPDVRDFRDDAKTFEGVAGITGAGRVALSGDDGEPEQVRIAGTTSNLFTVLGVPMAARPRLQRRRWRRRNRNRRQPARHAGAAQPAGPPPLPTIAILSHRLVAAALRRRSVDRRQDHRLRSTAAPKSSACCRRISSCCFRRAPGIEPNVDIWTALRLNFDTAARNTGALRVIARLKPGVTLAAGTERMPTAWPRRCASSFRRRRTSICTSA